jgi:hypothetical protein
MMAVARMNRERTKSCGGSVATPILVKRKLPPQKRVVRTRKKYTRFIAGGVATVMEE